MSIGFIDDAKNALGALSDLITGGSKDWRDDVQDASFKGVPFLVIDTDTEFGRRLVTFEYPDNNEGQNQDLGRKQRRFAITGFVQGNDFIAQTNALIDALETERHGLLIHPFFGNTEVDSGEHSVAITADAGGVAVFSMQFIEKGITPEKGASAPDTGAGLLGAATDAIELASTTAADAISLVGEPFEIVNAATNKINGELNLAINRIKSAATQSARAIQDFVDSPKNLASQSEILTTFRDIQTLLSDVNDSETFALLGDRAGEEGLVDAGDTVSSVIQNNENVLNRFFMRTYVALSCQSVFNFDFVTADQAIEFRNRVSNQINLEAQLAETVEDYNGLVALRTDLNNYINGLLGTLPRDLQIFITGPISTLQLAWQLYADADRNEEIQERNNLQDPGYITNQTLSVLSL